MHTVRAGHNSHWSHYEKRVDTEGHESDPICIDDEIPFEIPESWEWRRLGSFVGMQAGKTIAASMIVETQDERHPYPCYGGNGLRGYVATSNRIGKYPIIGRQGALCGCINYAEGEFYATEHAVVVTCFAETNVDWCGETLVALNLNQYATATAQPGLAVSKLSEVLIPIPPLAEQRRIVVKVNGLMPLVEQYGALEDARERLDAGLPGRLRNSVLQLAVEGKLVPQDPADEPASALLERIRAERAELIEQKKLKAPKGGESVIYRGSDGGHYEKRGDGETICIDDEIPFEIPESWVWARMSSVFNLVRGNGIKRSEVTEAGSPCVRYGELYTTYDGTIDVVASHTNPTVYDRAQKLLDGEVVATLTGENDIDIGRSVVNKSGRTIAFGGDLLALKGEFVNGEFAMLCMNSPYMGLQRTAAASGNIIVHLSAGKIGCFLIAVPPLAEQRRIVAKVKELIPLFSAR